jgi:hypothetical protein
MPSGSEYNISLFFCREEVERFSCVCNAFLFQCPRIYIDPSIGTYVPSQNHCPLQYSPTNALIYHLDGVISSEVLQ